MTHTSKLVDRGRTWGALFTITVMLMAGVAVQTDSAEALTCTGRDYRAVKSRTYVPGAGYFYDVKMTKCAAKRMADAWGIASGSTGVAGTVIGLFNGWTGFALGALSASQWLTVIKLDRCSKTFTSNIIVTVKGGQIIGCKAYSGSVGGGTL